SAPPTSTGSAAPSPPPPTSFPLGLGPLVVASDGAAPAPPIPLATAVTRISFGDAAFAHADVVSKSTAPPCPYSTGPDDGACALYSVSAGKGGAWSAPRRAPRAWTSFSGGRAVVYAVRGGDKLAIDTIDAKGATSPWLEAEAPSWLSGI